MGYYLQIISPSGERKEGKLILKLAQAGAYLHLMDDDGEVVGLSKFIIKLDEDGVEFVPLEPKRIVMDDQPPQGPDSSNSSNASIPEYPELDWAGEFSYGRAHIDISPVPDDEPHRQRIASVRLSWGTSADEYRFVLQGLIDIAEEVGLQISGGGFASINNADLDNALRAFQRSAAVVCDMLGVVREPEK
jgi:hypothetical protein